MDRGRGQCIPTKSMRGKWVAIELDMEYAYTIKVKRQSNPTKGRLCLWIQKCYNIKEIKLYKICCVFQIQNMISICEIYE